METQPLLQRHVGQIRTNFVIQRFCTNPKTLPAFCLYIQFRNAIHDIYDRLLLIIHYIYISAICKANEQIHVWLK